MTRCLLALLLPLLLLLAPSCPQPEGPENPDETLTLPPEVDPPEVNPPEVNPPEVDPPEVNPPEVDPPEVVPPEVDPPEVDPPEVVPPEVDPPEVVPPEVVPPEVVPPEVVPPEVVPPEVVPPEVVPPEVVPPEVVPPEVVPPDQTPISPPEPKPSTDICTGISPIEDRSPPLWCFTCDSVTSAPNPQCDHKLWKFLRHSERLAIRALCPMPGNGSSGFHCYKRVSRRGGVRRTERGCFNGSTLVPGPRGTTMNASDGGCYTFRGNQTVTTTCFCTSSECNPAGEHKGSTRLGFSAVCLTLMIWWNLGQFDAF